MDMTSQLETFKKGTPVKFLPFMVTLDGVKVTGVAERTMTYAESGNPTASDKEVATTTSVASALKAAARPMLLAARPMMMAAAPEQETKAPVITKVFEGQTETETLSGSSVSFAEVDGKVFAGWFTDAAFTAPADFSAVTEDTTVYGKYVDDAYLQFGTQEKTKKNVRQSFTVFFALKSEDVASAGFVIDGEKVEISKFVKNITGTKPADVFSGADKKAVLATADLDVKQLKDGITVTAYWVTKDGTTVYGETRDFN